MKIKNGFTLVETAIVVVVFSLMVGLIWKQKTNIDAMTRDESRKTAINAMYYALEESFYSENGYYPEQISKDVLPVVGSELWIDPDGYDFSDVRSSYKYEPANCINGQCKEYMLSAKLEQEDKYIKVNR